jgi:carbonic anhydrase
MMKFVRASLVLWLTLVTAGVYANEESAGNEAEQLRGIVKNLLDDNTAFAKSHKADYYKPFAEKQHPRATVVTCSDSRVHTHALDKTPDGDLFMVRNIGNQIATAEGSVEYGVLHLHTPLLIIVGHVACGAIKAAQGDYAKLEEPIKRELNTIKLPKKNPKNDEDEEWLRGVDANVNNQVAVALKKFENEIKEGKLTVVGAVYDFQNALHQGQGRLVITNINGNTDAGNIMSGLMKMTGAGAQLEKKPAGKKPAH